MQVQGAASRTGSGSPTQHAARQPKQPRQPVTEPLRERRKRELRQLLSDVATRLFLEHGFDEVRVADIARACGVTEKTVFNHFRSKESLLADRWDTQMDALLSRLANSQVLPVDAVLEVLQHELDFLTSSQGAFSIDDVRRFGQLIQSTPALVAHSRDALDRITAAVAAVLAQRTGTTHEDPVAWITATAVAGLWLVYSRSLQQHLPARDSHSLAHAVRQDLRRAADTLRKGL